MNDDQVARAIHEIECALVQEDPIFLRRVRQLHRREAATVLSVFALLAAGAVLLTVGLATLSWVVWCGGLLSLVIAAVVDQHHQSHLRRFP